MWEGNFGVQRVPRPRAAVLPAERIGQIVEAALALDKLEDMAAFARLLVKGWIPPIERRATVVVSYRGRHPAASIFSRASVASGLCVGEAALAALERAARHDPITNVVERDGLESRA